MDRSLGVRALGGLCFLPFFLPFFLPSPPPSLLPSFLLLSLSLSLLLFHFLFLFLFLFPPFLPFFCCLLDMPLLPPWCPCAHPSGIWAGRGRAAEMA